MRRFAEVIEDIADVACNLMFVAFAIIVMIAAGAGVAAVAALLWKWALA